MQSNSDQSNPTFEVSGALIIEEYQAYYNWLLAEKFQNDAARVTVQRRNQVEEELAGGKLSEDDRAKQVEEIDNIKKAMNASTRIKLAQANAKKPTYVEKIKLKDMPPGLATKMLAKDKTAATVVTSTNPVLLEAPTKQVSMVEAPKGVPQKEEKKQSPKRESPKNKPTQVTTIELGDPKPQKEELKKEESKKQAPVNIASLISAQTTPPVPQKSTEISTLESCEESMKYSKDMPSCFEKTLITLNYYLALAIAQLTQSSVSDQIYNESDFHAQIRKCIDEIKDQYQKEGLDDVRILDTIQGMSKAILNSGNYHTWLEKLIQMLQQVRPFSFQEFFDLTDVCDKGAEEIDGKNILLLLGSTGCGKSTTIQYLYGLKMARKLTMTATGSELPHVEAEEEITNERLKKIVTKPDAKSVTRFVTPIDITYQDDDDNTKEIMLVDTPGSGDTQSSEVDISNSIGIIKAVKFAQNVYPVLIFSYRNLGGRYEVLKGQIIHYAKMIKDVKKQITHFNYFFTSVDPEWKEKMNEVIKEVDGSRTSNEKLDKTLETILNDMKKKGKNGKLLVIDPLAHGEYNKILQTVADNDPIDLPSSVFQLVISQKSKDTLNKQVSIHVKLIKAALLRGDNAQAKWRMDELARLAKIFDAFDKTYQERYDGLVKSMEEILIGNTDNILNLIKRSLSQGNQLIDQDVKDFQKAYTVALNAEVFRAQYLPQAPSAEDLLSGVTKIVTDLVSRLSERNINDGEWFELMDKAEVLGRNMQAQFGHISTQITKKYIEKIHTITNEASKILKDIDINRYSKAQFQQTQTQRDRLAKQASDQINFENSDDAASDKESSQEELIEMGAEAETETKSLPHQNSIALAIKRFLHKKAGLKETPDVEFLEKVTKLYQAEAKLGKRSDEITNVIDTAKKTLLANIYQGLNDKVRKHIDRLQIPSTTKKFVLLDQEKVDKLQSSIIMLENFLIMAKKIHEKLEKQVQLIKDDFMSKCQALFDHHIQALFEIIYNNNTKGQQGDSIQQVTDLKEKYLQIELIRSIDQMTNQTNQQFFTLKSAIDNKVNDKKREIVGFLKLIQHQDQLPTSAKVDYYTFRNLKEALKIFIELGQIYESSETSQQFVESNKKEIIDKIKNVLEMLEGEVSSNNVESSKWLNLARAGEVYNQIKEIYDIAKILDVKKGDIKEFVGLDWLKEISNVISTIHQEVQAKTNKPIRFPDYKRFQDYICFLSEFKNRKKLLEQLENDSLPLIFQDKQIEESTRRDFKAEELLKKVKSVLSKQYELLKRNFESHFALIQQEAGDGKKVGEEEKHDEELHLQGTKQSHDLKHAADEVISIMKLITNVQTRFPELFTMINELSQDEESTLLEIFSLQIKNWIQDDVEFIQNDKIKFTEKFQAVKALRDADMYMVKNEDKIISRTYQIFYDKVYHDPAQEFTKAKENFNQKNFDEVKKQIASIDQAAEKSPHFKEISKTIKSYIKAQVEDHNQEIRKFIFDIKSLSPDEIRKICLEAAFLIKVDEHLDEYIQELNINRTLLEVFDSVSKAFDVLLDKAVQELNNKRFYQASELHDSVSDLLRAVQFNATPNLKSKIQSTDQIPEKTKILDQQKELLQKAITNFYQTVEDAEFRAYASYRPKIIYENILKIQNSTIREAVNQSQDAVSKKYEDAFKEIEKEIKENSEADLKHILKNLKEIEESLQYQSQTVSDRVKPTLNRILESVRRKHEKTREVAFDQFATLQNKEIEDITSYILSLKKGMLKPDKKTELGNLILRKFREQCTQASTYINQGDIQSSITNFNKMQYYFDTPQIAEHLHQNAKSEHSTLTSQLNQFLASALNELSKHFPDNRRASIIKVNESAGPEGHSLRSSMVNEGRNRQMMMDTSLAIQIIQQIADNYGSEGIMKKVIPDFQTKISQLMKKAAEYYKKLKTQAQSALAKSNIKERVEALCNLKQFEQFFAEDFERLLEGTIICQNEIEALYIVHNEGLKSEQIVKNTLGKLQQIWEDSFKQGFQNDQTSQDEKTRADFYQQVNKGYDQLKQARENGKYNLFKDQEEDLFALANKHCEDQINQLVQGANENIRKMKNFCITKDEYTQLERQYRNLLSMRDNLNQNFQSSIKQGIDSTETEIYQKLADLRMEAKRNYKDPETKNLRKFAENLIELQIMNENMIVFKPKVAALIDELLNDYQDEYKKDKNAVVNLKSELQLKAQGVNLVQKHSIFQGQNILDNNKKFQSKSVDDVLAELSGTDLDKEGLKKKYNDFKKEYYGIIENAMQPEYDPNTNERLPITYQPIVSHIRGTLGKRDLRKWTEKEIRHVPTLMANLFALWTLLNAEHFEKQRSLDANDENLKGYLMQPHAAQIISILRILGVGYSETQKFSLLGSIKSIFGDEDRACRDNLVQIKTGEGKSVTLAVVSMIFALHGFDVRCACYSKYLSERDFKSFESMFDVLGLKSQIKYGTFNEICELQINKDGEVRDIILDLILKGDGSQSQKVKRDPNPPPEVLLIDEVDVFFSPDFYGNTYTPQAVIQHDLVTALIDKIWSMKDQKLKFREISSSSEFQACKDIFKPEYANLLDEAVKEMLCDLQDYESHEYILSDKGEIGYKLQDQISYNINQGYKTMFAYFLEHSRGAVSDVHLSKQKVIGINTAEFSYAEVPLQFSIILGVTGTLDTLSKPEKDIIEKVYNIKHNTISPSVHGNSKLMFNSHRDIFTLQKSEYYNILVDNINSNLSRVEGERACLVFFETDQKLQQFKDSPQFLNFKNKCIILNERVDNDQKESYVVRATQEGAVTLATRAFGRGTDFICNDPKVLQAGGLHVIQTFLSEDESEEVQIKGRTSRQGTPGSYSMVLLYDDLIKFNIEEEDIIKSADKYATLKQFRNLRLENAQKETTNAREELRVKNDRSLLIMEGIKDIVSSKPLKDQTLLKKIPEFLIEMNKSGMIETEMKVIKTLVLIDATGSMGSTLQKTKNSVEKLFETAAKVLRENDLDEKLFLIQIACYRNYSSREDILISSSWESKAVNLKEFLNRVSASGGQGNEAIEIGLAHANHEMNNCGDIPLSQVFIIGDALPNTQEEVAFKRQGWSSDQKQHSKTNEAYWKNAPAKYKKSTYWETELQPLKAAGIPIHAFYIINPKILKENRPAKEKELHKAFLPFTEGATPASNGKCMLLEIDDEQKGAQQLQDFFTEQILQRIGEMNGGAEKAGQLLEAYNKIKKQSYR